MDLINLATLYRAINLYSHHAHNLTFGDEFLQDHSFFGEIYPLMDDFYDALIERHIGTVDDNVDLADIMDRVTHMISLTNKDFYKTILSAFENALAKIEKLAKSDLSQGTINMLVGQADQLEVLVYKIKRRMKDED